MIRSFLTTSAAVLAFAAGFGSFVGTASAQDGASVTLGGAVGVKPKYEGSDEYEAFGIPIIFPKFGGASGFGSRFSFRGPDDVRFRALEFGGFEVGPLGGYAFGRDEDDADRLLGLGDVDDGLVVGAYAAFTSGPVLLDVSYHQIVTGDDDGALLRFGGGLRQQLSPGFTATLRGGATYADDTYMDSYFGISQAQAATSAAGLNAFNAEAGIKDVFIELGAVIDLSDRWTVRASGKYSKLVGDAADSPVVESEDQFSGLLGATYRFDLRR